MPTQKQRDRAEKIIRYEVRDPMTDVRQCRWCGTPTPEEYQEGGEYLCPSERGGCGRWQHEKAFPDGIPGLTQEKEKCPHCGAESEWAPNEDDALKRCPSCRQDMHPEAAVDFYGAEHAALPQAVKDRVTNG